MTFAVAAAALLLYSVLSLISSTAQSALQNGIVTHKPTCTGEVFTSLLPNPFPERQTRTVGKYVLQCCVDVGASATQPRHGIRKNAVVASQLVASRLKHTHASVRNTGISLFRELGCSSLDGAVNRLETGPYEEQELRNRGANPTASLCLIAVRALARLALVL